MSPILGLLHEYADNDLDVNQIDQNTYEISMRKKFFPELFQRLTNYNITIEQLVLGTTKDTICTCVFRRFTIKNN